MKGLIMKNCKKIFLMLALMLTSVTSVSAVSAVERAALAAFYNSTNGDTWQNILFSWNINDPLDEPCFWDGIFCDANGNVTTIFMGDNNLTGSIPPEIGDLTALEGLILFGGNQPGATGGSLTGSIPTEIGNLTNLQLLDLSFNQLSGSIPTSIGNLSGLFGLYLESNELTGTIPASIGNPFSSLGSLYLNDNHLGGEIPSSIENLFLLPGELRLQDNCSLRGSTPEMQAFIEFNGNGNAGSNGLPLTYEEFLGTQRHCYAQPSVIMYLLN